MNELSLNSYKKLISWENNSIKPLYNLEKGWQGDAFINKIRWAFQSVKVVEWAETFAVAGLENIKLKGFTV